MKKLIAAVAIAAVGFLGTGVGVASATETIPPVPQNCVTGEEVHDLQVTFEEAEAAEASAQTAHDTAVSELKGAEQALGEKDAARITATRALDEAEAELARIQEQYDAEEDPSPELQEALAGAKAAVQAATDAKASAVTAARAAFNDKNDKVEAEAGAKATLDTKTGDRTVAEGALKDAQAKPVCMGTIVPDPADPEPTDPAEVVYENCTDVWNKIGRSLKSDDPGYEAPRLDGDSDGTACEIDPRGTSTSPAPPTTSGNPVAVDLVSNDGSGGDLAYTGASHTGTMLGIGGLLVALGGLGLLLVRRRSQA